ncbi:MAG: hypothetical protein WD100_07315, partial [Tistlia sp.]
GRSTFEVLAAAAAPERAEAENLLVAIDSQRGDLFVQVFPRQGAPEPPFAADAAAAARRAGRSGAPLLLAGSGALRLGEALDALGENCRIGQAVLPDAATLAILAAEAPLPALGSPPPRAVYLRPPDTTAAAAGP